MKKWLIPIGITSFFAIGAGVFFLVPDVKAGVIETFRGTVKDTSLVVGGGTPKPEVEYVTSDLPEEDLEQPQEEITTEDGGEIVEINPNLEIRVLPTKGDAIIVKEGNTVALINAGFDSDVPIILKELSNLGVKRLKYIVSLNNHASSVGGLTGVSDKVAVDYILLSGSSEARKESLKFIKYLDKERLLWSVPADNAKYRLKDTYLDLKSTTRTGSLYATIVNGVSRFTVIGTTQHFPEESIGKVGQAGVLFVNTSSQGYKLDMNVVTGIAPKSMIVNDLYAKGAGTIKKSFSEGSLDVQTVAKGKTKVVYSDGKDFRIE